MPADVSISYREPGGWTIHVDLAGVSWTTAARLAAALSEQGWRAHGPAAGPEGWPWRLIVRRPWTARAGAGDALLAALQRAAADVGIELDRVVTTDASRPGVPPAPADVAPAPAPAPTEAAPPATPAEVQAPPAPAGAAPAPAHPDDEPARGPAGAPAEVPPSLADPARLPELLERAGQATVALRDRVDRDPAAVQAVLARAEPALRRLQELVDAAAGIALLASGLESEAYDRLKGVRRHPDLLGSRWLEVQHLLARRALLDGSAEEALAYLDEVGPRGSPETEALRGQAYMLLKNPRRAVASLRRALELGHRDRATALAFANALPAGERVQAVPHLEALHAADPADLELARTLMACHERPEDIAAVAGRCIAALDRQEQVAAAADLFVDRAQALLRLGVAGAAEALADAVEALLLADHDRDALELVGQQAGRIGTTAYVEVLSLLETSTQADVRDRVVATYLRLAQDEVLRVPRHDADLLQDLAERLFILDRARYGELAELYELQRQELAGAPAGLVGPLREEWREPEAVSLAGERLVLVGGFPAVRTRVREQLRRYGAQQIAEVPAKWEAHRSQRDVRQKLERASVVVMITGCLAHATQELVEAAAGVDGLDDRIVYPRGRGQSSVVRDVLEHVRRRRGDSR